MIEYKIYAGLGCILEFRILVIDICKVNFDRATTNFDKVTCYSYSQCLY